MIFSVSRLQKSLLGVQAAGQTKELVRAESFGGGGLLRIDQHDVGGMNNINHLKSFRLKISRCQCTTYCKLRTFVCT